MKNRSPCGKDAESVLKKAVAIGSPPSQQCGIVKARPKAMSRGWMARSAGVCVSVAKARLSGDRRLANSRTALFDDHHDIDIYVNKFLSRKRRCGVDPARAGVCSEGKQSRQEESSDLAGGSFVAVEHLLQRLTDDGIPN